MKPAQVTYENQKEVLEKLNDKMKYKPKYSKGDKVRVVVNKKTFEKGYTPNYTLEIFLIRRVNTQMKHPMYFLKDAQGVNVAGAFYEDQLQLVQAPVIYRIEKILRQKNVGRGAYVLVKFVNHDKPTWMKKSNILSLPERK